MRNVKTKRTRIKKWMLHDLSHILIPFIVSWTVLFFNRGLEPVKVGLAAFAGALLPDIDHLNIWREYKFKNFVKFLKFCITADRYRRSFLIFHNFATIVVLIVLIPFVSTINFFASIFLLSFLCHLFLDFFDDKITIGRAVQWRSRRKT